MKIIKFLMIVMFASNAILPQSKSYNEVDNLMKGFIKDKLFPGGVVLANKDGKTVYHKAFGTYSYDSSSQKVTKETIYDLASVSKVIATTTAAMICYDKKLFSLDDKVIKYIPEFGENDKSNITILNLMLHNSGLPAWKKFYEAGFNSKDDVLKDIFASKLTFETGTKMEYSDLGMITVGRIIEIVSKKSLDQFCKDEIFKPLGMNETFYNPSKEFKKRCAPTENDTYWRNRLLQGEVHDETAAMLNGVAGHAGLFSTTKDLEKILLMLVNKGTYGKNKRLIKEGTIKLFTRKYSDLSSRGIGWDTKAAKGSSAGNLFGKNSFGHTGFTGTSVWIDPDNKFFVILLTNRVHPNRNTQLTGVRPAIHNALFKACHNL